MEEEREETFDRLVRTTDYNTKHEPAVFWNRSDNTENIDQSST